MSLSEPRIIFFIPSKQLENELALQENIILLKFISILINKVNNPGCKKFGKGKIVISDSTIAQTLLHGGCFTTLSINGCFLTFLNKMQCRGSLLDDDSGRQGGQQVREELEGVLQADKGNGGNDGA